MCESLPNNHQFPGSTRMKLYFSPFCCCWGQWLNAHRFGPATESWKLLSKVKEEEGENIGPFIPPLNLILIVKKKRRIYIPLFFCLNLIISLSTCTCVFYIHYKVYGTQETTLCHWLYTITHTPKKNSLPIQFYDSGFVGVIWLCQTQIKIHMKRPWWSDPSLYTESNEHSVINLMHGSSTPPPPYSLKP